MTKKKQGTVISCFSKRTGANLQGLDRGVIADFGQLGRDFYPQSCSGSI
ncbi:hypothetical protein GF406_06745 [candidate division KSB1 bacterium]|nr:hypothetical protein [candidate division KSB1 bacterium]